MSLSKLDNMFTEASAGENASEIKEELPIIDFDFGIRELSTSHVPYDSFGLRADETSSTMVTSHILADDVLLSAVKSISFVEDSKHCNGIKENTIETDSVGPICESDLHGLRIDDGKVARSDSSDFACSAEPSIRGEGEAEVANEIDKIQGLNHPLIVYTSSRRKSVPNTNMKLNQNESLKPSRNCRRIAKSTLALDLNSLKISRKRRSLFSKQPRSSVWGVLGNMGPASEEQISLVPNLGNEKKQRRGKCGQGERSKVKSHKGQKSVPKSCISTGHISLKIKIGNQTFGRVNIPESLNAMGKCNPGLSDKNDRKSGEELSGGMLLPHERSLDKVVPSTVASDLATDLNIRVSLENTSLGTSNDLHQTINHEGGDNLRTSTENRCSDPGTSPDSEVINSVPDASLIEKVSQTMNDAPMVRMEGTKSECSTNSVPYVSFGDVASLSLPGMIYMEGKKKDKSHLLGDCIVQNKLTRAEKPSHAKTLAELGLGPKVVNVSYCNNASMIETAKPYLDATNCNEFPMDPPHCSRMLDSRNPFSTSQVYTGAEMNPSSRLAAAPESSKSQAGGTLMSWNNGQNSPKFSRAKGGRKSMSGVSNLPDKKDKASKKKGAKINLVVKNQIDEKGDANGVLSGAESHLTAGNQASSDHVLTEDRGKNLSGKISNSQFSSAGISNQYVPLRKAWVLCDDCQKWRRIPAILADQIEETNCGWTCKENTDEHFADCSIPQEKSNSEINEELEISDVSCEEDACGALLTSNQNLSRAAQQSSFSLIKSNLFLHRNRKTQTIDEVMVCHCKPPPDGRMGCGAKCLNRMLNIECVRGTCPCGERCSNQQFQKRNYAKLKWFRCGKKGFGLQALEDISSGQFLVEYVGEVLDMHAYEARQKEYAVQGHKHFYFMMLNGSEVIDASAKGNLGRFINHSCDPNCRTEKWMVNGEVCVGLFAVRDIKKGEEVTFDYNFVRVFGAAAKKCVCGSPNCRGYIGGDPTNSEVVQEDSDDEFVEPVMTCEDREMNEDWKDILLNCSNDRESVNANELQEKGYRMKILVDDAGQFETVTSETLFQKVGGSPSTTDECSNTPTSREVNDVIVHGKSISVDNDSASNDAVRLLAAKQDTGASSNNSVSAAADAALPGNLQPNTTESMRKLKYGIVQQKEDLVKADPLVKTRNPSSSIKKGKLKFNAVNDKGTRDVDKSNAVLNKSKKLPEVSVNSHVEAVEDKLNELLNKEGGISKRNDASRGYLKLLFLTAASGTNGHGEAIQSNRDLSMILDALLKTKSRSVLVDITNKNGLQMLHNIMKRYRKEFNKTPILRKLLKVLEYLAMREILTLEHITGGPPCPGVESFKDSILSLTEHADKQVHQIARNFRDRYIPRSLRRNCFVEMDDLRIGTHHNSSNGRLSASSQDNWSDRGGKPAESVGVDASTQDHSTASGSTSGTNGTGTRKRKSRWDNPEEDHLHPRSRCDIDEDIPPGFLPPYNPSTVPFDTVLGNPQQRFIARVPLSYGVPVSVMQQFGVLQAEIAKGWTVAPGLPFHPFPPLPPYPKCAPSNELEEKAEQGNDTCIPRILGQKRTAPCSMAPPGANSSEQEGDSNNLGRKYFRQQKWNHSKLAPPWVRMRNHGWEHADGRNQFRNSCN